METEAPASQAMESDVSEAGWLSTSTWLLLLSAGLLGLMYDYWCHQFLSRYGIQSPTPLPILGNMLWLMRHDFQTMSKDCRKKFGKVYGMYIGRRPLIMISDVDRVQQICVKDFAIFTNRKPRGFESRPFDKSLLSLRDKHWKGVRSVISPTFSASKMKLMAPIINKCLDPTIKIVAKLHGEGKNIQCKDLYGSLTLDTIGNCAFGMEVNCQDDPNNPFLENSKKIFDFSFMNFAVVILLFFPGFTFILNKLNVSAYDYKAIDFFDKVVDESVHLRHQSEAQETAENKRVDFLQLMLNVHKETTTDEAAEEATQEEKEEAKYRQSMSEKKLTMEEIKAQAMLFFLGGYETTSTTLSMASYLLATNPDIQDKLIAEVDSMAPTRDDVTYDIVFKMAYLDMVVCETLRFYPPNMVTTRFCASKYTYKGITLPPLTEIAFDVLSIHHDPELWTEPDKFIPERFTKEERERRHPCAWLPFGFGPRNCVAMRFALLQVKIALIRMLQNYRLETCAETEIPPKLGKMGFITPPNGVILSVVPRSHGETTTSE
ncbi:cytochrome P450 3A29-like [Patiria miniata]|uniref:Thromboxane-A synthase n=1 Tax=Patiria miniata TaxID=46514 RepID=A0A913ZN71_PATMI|nr:cytochrome P450 3A29-like [Patiria miniata]XP_038052561.1 cytochrome P450 3A29-like [Patiria miniata]